MDIPLPGELGVRARDLLAGRLVPVPARAAATVALLREPPLEVYLLRRAATMAFAAGAYVFPGGSVDPRDAVVDIGWAGPPPADWAVMLSADEDTARSLVCAAVRETFEESGVLLAGWSAAEVVPDTTGWEAERLALISRELSFADFLAANGLVLRSDLLKPWAHWITPEIETRRFDTRFFVAALPSGQRTRDVGGEADTVVWTSPAEALTSGYFLMPPTLHTLTTVSAFETVADVFAGDPKITTVMPVPVEKDGQMVLTTEGQI
ncbi:NUDIX hydrolase [Herbidospora cretacea]|uniref:NUDIX hydrolase n=1 Tax=Herbidospora cretacea TaxID=28444 RepID=UPI000A6FABE0